MKQSISSASSGVQDNISLNHQFTQRLIAEFNAAEGIWRKLEWKRKMRHLLKPKKSRKKQRKLDLDEFEQAQPPKDCIGFWRI